jgi:hypothetical protein
MRMGGSVRKRDFIVTPASDHPHYDQVGFSDAFDVLATVSQNEADIERIEFDDRGVRPGGEHRHPPLALNRVLLVIDRVQRREFRKYHSVSLEIQSIASLQPGGRELPFDQIVLCGFMNAQHAGLFETSAAAKLPEPI